MEVIVSFFKLVGGFVVGVGGLSLITYQIFKRLSEKWLDSKFDQRLQSLKHEQGKELEKLRLEISMLLDRAVKLNQQEFEVLPEAWSKLNESFWATKGIVGSLQMFPDLTIMDEQQLNEFIDELDFKPWEKRELRAARDRNKFYQKQLTLRRLGEAKKKISEAAIYLSRKGIFIPTPILEKMKNLNDIVWRTFVEYELPQTHDGIPFRMDRLTEFFEAGEPSLAELETLIHKRLWPNEPAA
jgi:hypothetical protein